MIACTSGWFWQLVPSRLKMKAIASRRTHSTPRLANQQMMSANSKKTSGLRQLRSHCQVLKVVQTHDWDSSSNVKLPGAKSGKTSGRVRSYASGMSRSANMKK